MTKCSRCGKKTELRSSSFCRVCDQEHAHKMKEFMKQLQAVHQACLIKAKAIYDDFDDWFEQWMMQGNSDDSR